MLRLNLSLNDSFIYANAYPCKKFPPVEGDVDELIARLSLSSHKCPVLLTFENARPELPFGKRHSWKSHIFLEILLLIQNFLSSYDSIDQMLNSSQNFHLHLRLKKSFSLNHHFGELHGSTAVYFHVRFSKQTSNYFFLFLHSTNKHSTAQLIRNSDVYGWPLHRKRLNYPTVDHTSSNCSFLNRFCWEQTLPAN